MHKKKRIAIFASGGGTNFQSIIDGIKSENINAEIVLLVVSNDEAYAIKRAEENNIQVFVAPLKSYPCANCRDTAILEKLKTVRAEYIFLCGYLGIITTVLISKYRNAIVNIHPSLLPLYGGQGMHGLRVHEEVLRCGERVTGATVHFVDEGTDTGLVIMQKEIGIKEDDTPESLQSRVLRECEHVILPDAVRLICDGRVSVKNSKVIIK